MSETQTTVDSSSVVITPRRPKLDFGPVPSKPSSWFDNDPALTEWFHALSVVFPEGEKYFIESVVTYKDQISDPTLKKQVEGFVSQEMQHSAQHWKYNQRIQEEYHHNLVAINSIVIFLLSVPKWFGRKLGVLAVTCALEHFTAIMAQTLLETKEGLVVLSKMPILHQTIWTWHAVEETEHKAVAYDVYVAMGGGYIRRVLIFLLVSHQFCFWMFAFYFYMLWNRGLLLKWQTYKSVITFFLFSPGLIFLLAKPWLEYLRYNFHPWQHNNMHIIKQYASKIPLAQTHLK